jgi:hypothetical protein
MAPAASTLTPAPGSSPSRDNLQFFPPVEADPSFAFAPGLAPQSPTPMLGAPVGPINVHIADAAANVDISALYAPAAADLWPAEPGAFAWHTPQWMSPVAVAGDLASTVSSLGYGYCDGPDLFAAPSSALPLELVDVAAFYDLDLDPVFLGPSAPVPGAFAPEPYACMDAGSLYGSHPAVGTSHVEDMAKYLIASPGRTRGALVCPPTPRTPRMMLRGAAGHY